MAIIKNTGIETHAYEARSMVEPKNSPNESPLKLGKIVAIANPPKKREPTVASNASNAEPIKTTPTITTITFAKISKKRPNQRKN